jgi:hypothetical protein
VVFALDYNTADDIKESYISIAYSCAKVDDPDIMPGCLYAKHAVDRINGKIPYIIPSELIENYMEENFTKYLSDPPDNPQQLIHEYISLKQLTMEHYSRGSFDSFTERLLSDPRLDKILLGDVDKRVFELYLKGLIDVNEDAVCDYVCSYIYPEMPNSSEFR